MYKIENTTADIKLQHPQPIAPRFFVNDTTVKVSGIILNKPYKLQITAVAKYKSKKKKRVRSISYNSTLKEAVDDALAKRTQWVQELKQELKKHTSTDMSKLIDSKESLEAERTSLISKLATASADEIQVLTEQLTSISSNIAEIELQIQNLEAQVKNGGAITKMMTLDEAFEMYIEAQKTKFEARGRVYDEKRYRGVYDKHIRKVIGSKLLDNIDAEDIQKITNKMTTHRAKLDENGNKIPLLDENGKHRRYRVAKTRNGKTIYGNHGKFMYEMEERPASERTKRTIYQLINPIYTYVNNSNKIKYTVPTPASMRGLPPLENEKEVKEDISIFTELYHYPHPYYRNVFIWLMHGRRFGEVASLDYKDIDLENNTYTIRAENNKAKVDMTYILTKWQRETLNIGTTSGLVFPSMTDATKKINSGTITSNHWKYSCTLHDIRHIIGNTLVNRDVSIEVIGRILGHKPKKNIITNRYAKVSAEKANKVLCELLEEVFI